MWILGARFYREDSGDCFPREIPKLSLYFQNNSLRIGSLPYSLASSRESVQELGVEASLDFHNELYGL